MKKNTVLLFLAAIIALGSVLRVTGIFWALPSDNYFHANTYVEDEGDYLNSIRGFDPARLDFRIKNYVSYKTTFYVYALAAWIKAASLTGLVNISSSFDHYKQFPAKLARIYVSGRLMSVFFALLTVLMVFYIAQACYGDSLVSLAAAFLMAVTPVHVIWSHFMGTDSLLAFIVCLMLAVCLRILAEDKPVYYVFAGLLAGLAVTTKLSSAPLAVMPVLALLLSGRKASWKNIAVYFISILPGYMIGDPYGLFEPKALLERIKTAAAINVTFDPAQKEWDAFGSQPMWLFYLTKAPLYSFGLPLSLLFAAGMVNAAFRRSKSDILLLAWIILFYAFISAASGWQILRWQFPYIPFLCVLAAKFTVDAVRRASGGFKYAVTAVIGAALLYTVFYSAAFAALMARQDVRDEASEWIEQALPEGTSIGVNTISFFHPSILLTEHWYKPSEPIVNYPKKYEIVIAEWDAGMIEKKKPSYIILSDFEYYPLLNLPGRNACPRYLPFLNEVTEGGKYELARVFKKKVELLGLVPLGGFYPFCLRTVFPEIRVYKRLADSD